MVTKHRTPCESDNGFFAAEQVIAEMVSASLGLYRDLRDATTESLFFRVYGGLIALGVGEASEDDRELRMVDVCELPPIQQSWNAR